MLVIFCAYGFRASANRVRASDSQTHLPEGQVGIFNFVEHWLVMKVFWAGSEFWILASEYKKLLPLVRPQMYIHLWVYGG